MVGAICMVSTGLVTVLGSKFGFESSIITLTSSCAKPPCSACFLELPEYVTPTFGVTRMSGVRGSFGGSPGALKSCVSAGPEKISPMPAILAFAGDCVSSMFTALSVVQLLLSQTIETSSSVGPMPVGLDGDSERGKQLALSRMVAGDVVTGPPAVIPV